MFLISVVCSARQREHCSSGPCCLHPSIALSLFSFSADEREKVSILIFFRPVLRIKMKTMTRASRGWRIFISILIWHGAKSGGKLHGSWRSTSKASQRCVTVSAFPFPTAQLAGKLRQTLCLLLLCRRSMKNVSKLTKSGEWKSAALAIGVVGIPIRISSSTFPLEKHLIKTDRSMEFN